jgi:type I restriction enzyme, S subunit
MKPYPKYKDSGVEWVDKIPFDWFPIRLKFCSDIINGYAFSSDSYVDDGVPIIRIGDIKPNIDLFETKNVPHDFIESHASFKIQFGDILLALTGATIGKMAVYSLKNEALLNQRVGIIRPKEKITNSFLKYVIASPLFKNHIDYECVGGAQDNIGKPEIGEYRSVLPPKNEQEIIVKFLDCKTAQIDTLIERKQKQIALLKEYRTAIINQAVTKGLNPDAKMRDSGIEWLGEIPAHWKIIRLKYISHIKYGLGQPPKELEGGLPLIRATNIERGKINANGLLYVDPNDIPYERDPVLKENDIIVVRSGAYTGDSAIITKEFDGSITGYDLVLRVKKENPKYIAYSLLSNAVLNNQIFLYRIRAAQPHLNAIELSEILIFLPPTDEQQAISSYLDRKTDQIEAFIAKYQNQIDQYKEYRTTLISEAVTGKINVRDEVAP